MANWWHLWVLRRGVGVWNRWRRAQPGTVPDLREANLSRADLSRADLSRADLSRAVLSRANLSRANLSQADLSRAVLYVSNLGEANLGEANLSEAHLGGAYLREANLGGANLGGANLSMAALNRADLTKADLRRTVLSRAALTRANFTAARALATHFADLDLRTVQGLDTIRHEGPSTVGIDTLYRSKGEISEVFLRGCGVPDSMIDYARDLVLAQCPIDYYSCFISYSSQDDALAKRLHADLQAAGVRCWYAPEDMKTGESIVDRIDHAIRFHDKLLLILSESAVASAWVGLEVKTALGREQREGRQVLFPIRIDDAVKESASGWAANIRDTRHITDFRQWQDYPAYQTAFARLLRDLQATPAR